MGISTVGDSGVTAELVLIVEWRLCCWGWLFCCGWGFSSAWGHQEDWEYLERWVVGEVGGVGEISTEFQLVVDQSVELLVVVLCFAFVFGQRRIVHIINLSLSSCVLAAPPPRPLTTEKREKEKTRQNSRP